MALMDGTSSLNRNTGIALGNRNDYCYLCATEIVGKDEREYQKKFNELKGKHEGKPMLKIYRSGTETCICLEHIHKIAEKNPLSKEDE
jgi:hypothetical protein